MTPSRRFPRSIKIATLIALVGAMLCAACYVGVHIGDVYERDGGAVDGLATGVSPHNANIRGSDGKLLSARLSTSPQGAEVLIGDSTGETLTTPTDAAIKSATLSLCTLTSIRGSTTVCTPVDGTITIKRSGIYRVAYCINSATVSAAATLTLKLFRKDGAGAAAEDSPRLRAGQVSATGGTSINVCTSGTVVVTAAQAVATGGQIFDVRATASAGNIVVKDYRFSMYKIDELDPATP